MFLNITPTVANWTADNKQFSLIFDENPLADFVELPDDGRAQDELWYSNILCGILRGSLEMVSPMVLQSKFDMSHAFPSLTFLELTFPVLTELSSNFCTVTFSKKIHSSCTFCAMLSNAFPVEIVPIESRSRCK